MRAGDICEFSASETQLRTQLRSSRENLAEPKTASAARDRSGNLAKGDRGSAAN